MANDPKSLYTVSIAKEYKYEKVNISGVKHNYDIALHHYSNNNNEIVYFAHGYLDNCGYTKPYMRLFLENGYDVICSELPGHGESSGSRADIDNFLSYKIMAGEVIQHLPNGYQKIHFVGHSTGNFGMMAYLLEGNKHPFTNIIMAAPLVRSYLWELSKVGIKLMGNIIKKLPRRDVIGDIPEYLALKKLDSKYIQKVPTHWAKELIAWNENFNYGKVSSETPIKLIFGTKDTVIDWKYNKKFFEDHFDKISIHIIKGSGHIFHYEKPEIKQEFFQTLLTYLKQ